MPAGSARTVELVANAPGDWVILRHRLHHAMTQMGHTLGNLIGMNTAGFDQRIRKLIHNYMTTGQDGMGDMGMPVPSNSLPMVCAQGHHDYITMGGMFTMLKVREELPADGSDPCWQRSPPGTLAEAAPEEDLKRDGIELHQDLPKSAARLSPRDQAWCGTPPKTPPLIAQSQPTARVKLQ
jgi:hypothetical protein